MKSNENLKMRKILIMAVVMAAIGGGGSARAAEKTFDEMFPATPSIEEWCASKTTRADDPSDHRGYNSCIDKAQMNYDYDKTIWNALSPERKGACVERWMNYKTPRVDYMALAGCLRDQVRAQDREVINRFNR
jgi:hypothetical protein